MLTNDTLLELNRMMLGLGAPVERDDQGYNQADYNSMFFYRAHTIIKADELPAAPAPKAKKASTKAPKATGTSTVNWKQYTTEQLQDKVTELGLTYTPSDNPNINRMRIIMALKKAM